MLKQNTYIFLFTISPSKIPDCSSCIPYPFRNLKIFTYLSRRLWSKTHLHRTWNVKLYPQIENCLYGYTTFLNFFFWLYGYTTLFFLRNPCAAVWYWYTTKHTTLLHFTRWLINRWLLSSIYLHMHTWVHNPTYLTPVSKIMVVSLYCGTHPKLSSAPYNISPQCGT